METFTFLERAMLLVDRRLKEMMDMGFLNKLMQVLVAIPALVMGFEGLHGAKKGDEKALAVLNIASLIVQDIPGDAIKDKGGFQDGLKMVNDGVVKCLNSSLWHK